MSENSLSGSRKSIAEEKNEEINETVQGTEESENVVKSNKSSPKSSQNNLNEGENKPIQESNDTNDSNEVETNLSKVIIVYIK